MSKVSGVVDELPDRYCPTEATRTPAGPAGIGTPATSTSVVVMRGIDGLHDRQPAQQFLDGGADGIRIVAHRRELSRVAQQRKGAQPQHVRRGLVAGQQQQAGDADQFVVCQLVAVLADQHAEDVVAGRPLALSTSVRM